MHNDRMNPPLDTRRWRALLAALFAAMLLLAGCSDSGDGESGGDDSSSGETEAGVEPYLPVPDGVELTTQGTELGLGEDATVAYEPRQGQVAALDITVERLDKASFKQFQGWKLSKDIKSTQPYFVHAKIQNVGETDLGDRRPPLYAVDGDNKLIESSTFASAFTPCPSANFPKKFKTGDSVDSCLVFLVPDQGDLEAVSFRPTEEFDPITWVGELTTPEPPSSDKKDDKKDKGKGDKNKNKGNDTGGGNND
jgi:hypothetical protein